MIHGNYYAYSELYGHVITSLFARGENGILFTVEQFYNKVKIFLKQKLCLISEKEGTGVARSKLIFGFNEEHHSQKAGKAAEHNTFSNFLTFTYSEPVQFLVSQAGTLYQSSTVNNCFM